MGPATSEYDSISCPNVADTRVFWFSTLITEAVLSRFRVCTDPYCHYCNSIHSCSCIVCDYVSASVFASSTFSVFPPGSYFDWYCTVGLILTCRFISRMNTLSSSFACAVNHASTATMLPSFNRTGRRYVGGSIGLCRAFTCSWQLRVVGIIPNTPLQCSTKGVVDE